MSDAQIAVKGVGKRFANGVAALKGVSLEVRPGEVVVVVGPSVVVVAMASSRRARVGGRVEAPAVACL